MENNEMIKREINNHNFNRVGFDTIRLNRIAMSQIKLLINNKSVKILEDKNR